ncbi:peptidase S14, partial [Campylobacter coli]|nr:peptidase S14 [Campylobacter coli]
LLGICKETGFNIKNLIVESPNLSF